MSQANPLWGAPRIHGELLKLGIEVAQSTVAKYLRRPPKPPSQTWRTFLTNHMDQMASIDFFVVPTATFRILFVFVVLLHARRRVLHFQVTEHPTQQWTMQQMREAFPWDHACRYLLRDRDATYGRDWAAIAKAMGMEEVLSAPRSPWQNPFVERLIGSVSPGMFGPCHRLESTIPVSTSRKLLCLLPAFENTFSTSQGRSRIESSGQARTRAARREGLPLDRRNLLRKHVKPAAKKLGLTGVTWHLLRHSYATMLDGVGTPVGTMQSLLGHSTPEITREIYLHAIPEEQRRAVESVERLVFGPKWTQVAELNQSTSGSVN
jgi:hypothetical protein